MPIKLFRGFIFSDNDDLLVRVREQHLAIP